MVINTFLKYSKLLLCVATLRGENVVLLYVGDILVLVLFNLFYLLRWEGLHSVAEFLQCYTKQHRGNVFTLLLQAGHLLETSLTLYLK